MTLTQDDMKLFEQKFSMYVLLEIGEHPNSTKTDIMRLQQGNEKTKFQRINEMIVAGLIDQVQCEGYSTKRLILSQKGKEAVEAIKILRNIACNSEEAEEEDNTALVADIVMATQRS